MNDSSSRSFWAFTRWIHENNRWTTPSEKIGTDQKNSRTNGVFHRFMGVKAVNP